MVKDRGGRVDGCASVGNPVCSNIRAVQYSRYKSRHTVDNNLGRPARHGHIREILVRKGAELMKSQKMFLLVAFTILLFLLTGCQRDYTIEITYVSELPPGALADLQAQSSGTSITIAQFIDSRDTIGVAGAKNPIGNVAVPYNSTKPVAEVVRDTLAEEFAKVGFEVDTMGLWNLQPETLKNVATTLAMGGEVKVFWAENRPTPGTYSTGGSGFSNVRIRFVLANPASEEIIWQGEIEGGVTRSALFRTPDLAEMLEKAFSQVIDRLLTNPELIRALGSV